MAPCNAHYLRHLAAKLKAEAHDAGKQLVRLLVDHLNVQVQEVYDNQQRIAVTALTLRDETVKFAQQNKLWKATIAIAQEVLKEVGDLDNYMEAVKQETTVVAAHLRHHNTSAEGAPPLPGPSQKHAARLHFDIAAVLCGMRSCVLLDYVQLPPTTVAAHVQHIAAKIQYQGVVLILSHHGCLYIADRDQLRQKVTQQLPAPMDKAVLPQPTQQLLAVAQQLPAPMDTGISPEPAQQLPAAAKQLPVPMGTGISQQPAQQPPAAALRHPLLLEFSSAPGHSGMGPAWADAAAVEDLGTQLLVLQAAIDRACDKAPRQPGTRRGPARQQQHSSGNSGSTTLEHQAEARLRCVLVDLGRVRGLPLLPTLNGWLLGYPVVYLVRSQEEGEAAARCLSSSVLTLYQVHAGYLVNKRTPSIQLTELPRAVAANKVATAEGAAMQQLCAFTVPQQLGCQRVAEQVEALMTRLQHRCSKWHDLQDGAGGGTSSSGGLVLWTAPELTVSAVGPQPIML